MAQILAGRGRSAAHRRDRRRRRSAGVLPLPVSALKSALPVLGNPLNRSKAVPLTYDQFRFGFTNAVSEDEAKELHETYAVPAAGKPLFQAASANLNPWTEAKVDTKNPDRGPLLLISGEKDNTVPWAITKASYDQQKDNAGVTEVVTIPGRGHSLDHRQRVAGGRRDLARVRQALRVKGGPRGFYHRSTAIHAGLARVQRTASPFVTARNRETPVVRPAGRSRSPRPSGSS